jgi:hypothetical protein
LSSFAIDVTPVAFGFAGGLILNHTRNALLISRLARHHLGACCCRDGSFLLCGFCLNALPLFGLYPLPRGAPPFAGCGNCLTFYLPREPGRLRSFLCGTKGLKESSFCVGSGLAAIGKLIVSGIFQIFVPVEISYSRKVRPIWLVSR